MITLWYLRTLKGRKAVKNNFQIFRILFRTNLLQRDVEEVPFQLQPPASSDKNGNNEDCINKNDADVIVCTGDTESNKNKELLPYAAQV